MSARQRALPTPLLIALTACGGTGSSPTAPSAPTAFLTGTWRGTLTVQVNTGEESQKAGVAPQDADAFITEARERYGLPVQGLMCIPPQEEEPAMHFALLAKIAARNGLTELSMGMSDDFESAIRFGATQVRVGSALFGARL